MPLSTWHRRYSGLYVATDDTRQYGLRCVAETWHLNIYKLVGTGWRQRLGDRVAYGTYPSRDRAAAVVRAYSALGDDHDPAEHEGRARLAEALFRVCSAVEEKTAGP